MGILSGNPKEEPMHYDEVFGAWSYLLSANGLIAGYQVLTNHTGDEDLRKLLNEAIDQCKQEKREIEALLKENGVALPPAPPETPNACLNDIPSGARINDPEIAAMLSRDTATGLVACSTMIGQAIREDIGLLLVNFICKKLHLEQNCSAC